MAGEENRTAVRMQRRNAMLAWSLPLVLLAVIFALMPRGDSDDGPPMRRHMQVMNEAYLQVGDLVEMGVNPAPPAHLLIDALDRKPADFPPERDFARMWKASRDLAVRLLALEGALERKVLWLELVKSCETCHEKYKTQ